MALLELIFQILTSRVFLRDIPIREEGWDWIRGALILAAVAILAILQAVGSTNP